MKKIALISAATAGMIAVLVTTGVADLALAAVKNI